MIDDIVITATPESVFLQTIKCCPPNAVGTRAILAILNIYQPGLQPDESLRQENCELLPQASALTALAAVKKLLGSSHGAVRQFEFDLREEWKK